MRNLQVEPLDVNFEGFENASRRAAHIVQKRDQEVGRIGGSRTKGAGDVAHAPAQEMEILGSAGVRESLPLVQNFAKTRAMLVQDVPRPTGHGTHSGQQMHAPQILVSARGQRFGLIDEMGKAGFERGDHRTAVPNVEDPGQVSRRFSGFSPDSKGAKSPS